MPNWCENIVTIKGNKKNINKIKKIIRESDGFFSKLIPLNEHLNEKQNEWNKLSEEEQKEWQNNFESYEFNNGGYDERVKQWGTKWDVEVYSYNGNDNSIDIEFDSAWSPPLEGLLAISDKYKVDCHCSYREPGMCFAGEFEAKSGKIISEDHREAYFIFCEECYVSSEVSENETKCPNCDAEIGE